MTRTLALARIAAAVLAAGAGLAFTEVGASAQTPVCTPDGEPVELTGTVTPADARTYRELPVEVADGTTRVEVTYDWQELGGDGTVLDLGLWDADGAGTAAGFRGWSGSRGGRVATGQEPVFVQQDVAARGYVPGVVEPGTWTVDLGIATVGPGGAAWQVTVTCTDPDVGPPFEPDPVDPTHVADPNPGWYHADFHMHGFHSNPNAPDPQEIVDAARAAGLDFLPITEYVTGQHWDELGATQRANPDVVIWPGREIITYFGHFIVLGESRSVLEYRHGFDGVSIASIQDRTVADGALFGVAHPDSFPPPLQAACRGCFLELGSTIDWSKVTTFEVVNGPVLFTAEDIGGTGDQLIPNPFVQTAIDHWEQLLLEGHRITAVSGSDSKGVEDDVERRGYGSSATAVFASELSRPALVEALRAGRAYVQTRGALRSPEVELTARAPDGATAMIGDTLVADRAEMTLTVRGGLGQTVTVLRDGEPVGEPVPVTADPFTYTFTAERVAGSGPLGTFWRIDVADDQALTVVTNPIFLQGDGPPPAPPAGADERPRTTLPRTGSPATGPAVVAVALLVAGATFLVAARRRSERPFG